MAFSSTDSQLFTRRSAVTALARNRKAIDMTWVQPRSVIGAVCDKGGVGKTTFVSAFGAALAETGEKVLIIDANKQGNVSQDLGIPQAIDGEGNLLFDGPQPIFGDGGLALARSITNAEPLAPIEVPGRPNLYLCTGGPEFNRVKRYMATVGENEAPTVLAVSLRQVVDQFDYVLIDSPPEDEDMMKVVLAASRYIVCPTKTDRSSLIGLSTVAKAFAEIREDYNPFLELLGTFIFSTAMTDGGKSLNERRASQQAVMGDEGVSCPHGIPFVEKVGNSIRDWGMPVTELERKAIEENWPPADLNSVTRVARAWIRVIAYFQYELACRRAGHRPGAVDRIDLELDEKGNLEAVVPVYASHLTGASDEEVSA